MAYDQRSYWDVVANEIERRGNAVAGDDTPFLRYKRQCFLDRFLSQMPVAGRSVLEVGCGPGGNLSALTTQNPGRLAGCDIAPRMVEIASKVGVEVRLADGEIPFPDREFDLVFTVTVVQHNPDEDAAALVGEICRVSRSDVVLIEDTATRKGNGSYFLRPVADYVALADRHDFALVRSEPLRLRASEFAHKLSSRFFDRHERHEGEPVPTGQARAERFLLPMTRLLDPVGGDDGLTMLVFRRA